MSGWIKLHRCITSSWIYDEKPFSRLHAWIDLLLLASHKDNKFLLGAELVECKRGQVITSLRKLGEKWGWSRTKVSKYLDMLQQDNMVHVISDTRKTTISIINYDVYQSQNDTEMTPKSHGKAAEVTQKNTIKNDKNDKNVQEENIHPSSFSAKASKDGFDSLTKCHGESRSGSLSTSGACLTLADYNRSQGDRYPSPTQSMIFNLKRVLSLDILVPLKAKIRDLRHEQTFAYS